MGMPERRRERAGRTAQAVAAAMAMAGQLRRWEMALEKGAAAASDRCARGVSGMKSGLIR